MKVDVLQVKDAEFKHKFCFWSNWVDVAVFDYESTPYLLQMRVNRFNKKMFNAMRITGKYMYRQATCSQIGDLTQMKKQG
jgi:hypothetical protein